MEVTSQASSLLNERIAQLSKQLRVSISKLQEPVVEIIEVAAKNRYGSALNLRPVDENEMRIVLANADLSKASIEEAIKLIMEKRRARAAFFYGEKNTTYFI